MLPKHNFSIPKTTDTDLYLNNKNNQTIIDFSKCFFSKTISENFQLFKKMTHQHADRGMDFKVKNEYGIYAKKASVPFNGFAIIEGKEVERHVQSTEPFLKALRTLLQRVFSQKDLSAKSLGLETIPKNLVTDLISIITESLYFEEKFINESFKDYPFLSIIGFDTPLKSDRADNEAVFFEYNAGTPCGIEDQHQIYQDFQKAYPDLNEIVKDEVNDDQSHQFLRHCIDSNALSWTNQDDGISIVISPGVYSPAHMEILLLAKRSGMPLVDLNDLYIDDLGFCRIKTNDKLDPKVTGIYSRREESFLLFSSNRKIPLRSPSVTVQNAKLSKKYKIELEQSVLYEYIYDNDGNIIDLKLDDNGEPIYQKLFDEVMPNSKSNKDLLSAVWEKRLYISNLGGRIIDDKRLFKIIVDHVVPAYLGKNNGEICHPPSEILPEELEKIKGKAVVKVPNLSGGQGVHILPYLDETQQQNIINQVKENPKDFELQRIQEFIYVSKPSLSSDTYDAYASEWRLMIFLDGNSKVSFSRNSCLVRTAPLGSLKTNTSSGGGYGLGIILGLKTTPYKKMESFSQIYIGQNKLKNVQSFFYLLQTILDGSFSKSTNALEIEYQIKGILDVLEYENTDLLKVVNEYINEKIDQDEMNFIIKNHLHFIVEKNEHPVIRESAQNLLK